MNIASLQEKRLAELQQIAQDIGVADIAELAKPDLIYRILEVHAETSPYDGGPDALPSTSSNGQSKGDNVIRQHDRGGNSERPAYMRNFDPKKVALGGMLRKVGVLEVLPDGYGFLRSPDYRYHPSADDIYVSPSQIKRFSLQVGDMVEGEIRPPREGQRFFALIHVETINGRPPEAVNERTGFDYLTPSYTDKAFRLETTPERIAPRVLDLFCPLGIGHRVLVVAPPKSGRTSLLQQIAGSLATNHPTTRVLALLLNEQPDDIIDFDRQTRANVIATALGDSPERHVHMANLVIETARRMVETGHDVVLLVDSLTELVRSHNVLAQEGESVVKDVLDTNALRAPKSLFGSARTVEEGGSLTVIATVQVGTGSHLNETIYDEFKDASNSTITLLADLEWSPVNPTIDVYSSRTSREDALIPAEKLDAMRRFRKQWFEQEPLVATKNVYETLRASAGNAELLTSKSA